MSSRFTSVVLALTCFVSLLATPQALAMYDPGTGRFVQRDPIGYPDGMNAYAAYHVMRGGVDPSGEIRETAEMIENESRTCSKVKEWNLNGALLIEKYQDAKEVRSRSGDITAISYVAIGRLMDVLCKKDENGQITGAIVFTNENEWSGTQNAGSVRSAIRHGDYQPGNPSKFIEKYIIPSLPMWFNSGNDDTKACLKDAIPGSIVGPKRYSQRER